MLFFLPTHKTERTFVQNEQPTSSNESTGQRDHLPLPNGQVLPGACDRGVQREPFAYRVSAQGEEARGAERVVEVRVVVLGKRIDVVAKCAREEFGLGKVCQYECAAVKALRPTTCGMIVIAERRASRLIWSIGSPSKYTLPSVKMHRSRASVREL